MQEGTFSYYFLVVNFYRLLKCVTVLQKCNENDKLESTDSGIYSVYSNTQLADSENNTSCKQRTKIETYLGDTFSMSPNFSV